MSLFSIVELADGLLQYAEVFCLLHFSAYISLTPYLRVELVLYTFFLQLYV
jgi:hypothetical protein